MNAWKQVVFAVLTCTGLSAVVHAADYPTKPVKLVVGQPPGGPTDIAARVYADKMRVELGQPMLVENKPGAASQISIQIVAKSEPDGYSILYGGLGLATLPYLSKSYDIDSIRDITPISMIVGLPTAIGAAPSLGVNTLEELFADIKAHPGKRFYGNMGSTDFLTMEGFKKATGLPFETVRFNGAAPAFQAMFAGDIQIVYTTVGILKPLADQGKVKILAVTGNTRSPLTPNVPTIAESKDPQVSALSDKLFTLGWFGIAGPAKLPAEVVDRLYSASAKVTRDPEFAKRMGDFGLVPIGNTPAEFSKRLREDLAHWKQLTTEMNIKPQ